MNTKLFASLSIIAFIISVVGYAAVPQPTHKPKCIERNAYGIFIGNLPDGASPLIKAAANNNAELVQSLCSARPEKRELDEALEVAAMNHCFGLVFWLIDTFQDIDLFRAIYGAAVGNDVEMVAAIISNQSYFDKVMSCLNPLRIQSLIQDIAKLGHDKIVEIFIKTSFFVDNIDYEVAIRSLRYACDEGHLQVINHLLACPLIRQNIDKRAAIFFLLHSIECYNPILLEFLLGQYVIYRFIDSNASKELLFQCLPLHINMSVISENPQNIISVLAQLVSNMAFLSAINIDVLKIVLDDLYGGRRLQNLSISIRQEAGEFIKSGIYLKSRSGCIIL
jgi:hypothetical protein